MPEQQQKQGGSKGQKIGRWKRRPSNKAYVAELRDQRNKRRRIEAEAKRLASRPKHMATPRGHARAIRRKALQAGVSYE